MKNSALIRPPEQARSRETMDKILTAMEQLLAEKTFDQITIQEVALRSDTGISSIYARFRNKQTLVIGLHARLREQVIECLEEMTSPERWANSSTDEIIASVVPQCVKFYRKHAPLMRAALRIDLPEMRERQATVLKFASTRFNALISPRYPEHEKEVKFAVKSSVKMLVSLMYTSLIFNDENSSNRFFTNERTNIRMLTKAITALINSSHD